MTNEPKAVFTQYLHQLAEVASAGDATEESYYGTLAALMARIAERTHGTQVHVTTLPKKTEAGNPDFRLWNGTDRVIGYIEAKSPTQENLDHVETTEQLRRYRATFPNLILTNFLEFRLYRNGEVIRSVVAARPIVLNKLRMPPPVEKPDQLLDLLDTFLGFAVPQVPTAGELAVQLAKRTRFLRDIVAEQLALELSRKPGPLAGFFEAFQKYLIAGLTPDDFANLYAQTITYGLFAARSRSSGPFNRRAAFDSIPHTVGVLRDMFRFISLGDLPPQLEWPVDDIAEVLAVADAPGILAKYYREGKGSDPIIHFYETFLSEYDPEERERRGVYYTPEPVVSYIVRSIHSLLKTSFSKTDGLASDGITLLDPAAGTMTFVARAAQEAVHEFEASYGAGAREAFIQQHVLRNFYAFELMMAPYAVGHLKMGFFLEELGHRLADDERVPFYLTNALEAEDLEQSHLPGFSSLAEESRLAGEVKRKTPILVILGNPPYSGLSSNVGQWITGLIEDYKYVDGKHFGEKKHWLQDDYVKFLRFAQWKIEQAGLGVVGMITNHGYLDNPTFRGMRQSLMQTFDEIYIIDLHGNALKHEISPDGGKDENVFDIRQGVAVAFFIKYGHNNKLATTYHASLWGNRESKYLWLDGHDHASTPWAPTVPKSPLYLFVPWDQAFEATYSRYPSLPEVFPAHSVGIVTARDALTIHWDSAEVWKTVTVFSRMEPELARQAYKLRKDVRDWKVTLAQKDILASGPSNDRVLPLLYRPFDERYTYYTGESRGFIGQPQKRIMSHMLQPNLALVVPRRVEHVGSWQHAFATQLMSDHVAVSLKTVDYHFPLYIYPKPDAKDLFSLHTAASRAPNLNPALLKLLAASYGQEPSPEDVLHYAYAVLYCPTYRSNYSQFLRMDFPRVPFTADNQLFREVAALGRRLLQLHTLSSPELDHPSTRFQGEGDGRVANDRKRGFRYDPSTERVYVNKSQYFDAVPKPVWAYHVGGYQVCDKWLKDRRRRHLSVSEIQTYCRVVTALRITMDIQEALDHLYPRIEQPSLTLGGP